MMTRMNKARSDALPPALGPARHRPPANALAERITVRHENVAVLPRAPHRRGRAGWAPRSDYPSWRAGPSEYSVPREARHLAMEGGRIGRIDSRVREILIPACRIALSDCNCTGHPAFGSVLLDQTGPRAQWEPIPLATPARPRLDLTGQRAAMPKSGCCRLRMTSPAGITGGSGRTLRQARRTLTPRRRPWQCGLASLQHAQPTLAG